MRDLFTSLISLLAVLALGLTAGAMLAEAAILVPYWQSISPTEFFDWYGKNASLLADFYTPLEVGSAVLAIVTAVLYKMQGRPGTRYWMSAAVLSILVLLCFFVYFKDSNASFSNRAVPYEDLAAELVIWAKWQWVRVALGTTAFIAAVLGAGTE